MCETAFDSSTQPIAGIGNVWRNAMRSLSRLKLSTLLLTAMVAVAWGQPGAADEAGDSTVGLEPGGSGFALHDPLQQIKKSGT